MTGGRKGRRLSQEDRALWDGVTRSIKPLSKQRLRRETGEDDEPAPEKPSAVVAPRRVATAPQPLVKPKPAPSLAPLERKLKQRLRRGRAEIDARIDLHGDTQAEAHERLRRFLRVSQDKGATLVLVITGKGAKPGSREPGVLKRQVPLWLGLPEFRDAVLGFDTASPPHGGEGALYVRLRKKRRED